LLGKNEYYNSPKAIAFIAYPVTQIDKLVVIRGKKGTPSDKGDIALQAGGFRPRRTGASTHFSREKRCD